MTAAERQVAEHEAGHCAMALVVGLPVTEARRWTPDPRVLGEVSIPFYSEDMDQTKARKWALMLLCGPAMANEPLPSWPLDWHRTKDEKLLEIFCRYLGLDERGYDQLKVEMWELTLTKRFDRLFTVLTTWFEHRLVLDEYVLAWSMAKVMTWPEEEWGATL